MTEVATFRDAESAKNLQSFEENRVVPIGKAQVGRGQAVALPTGSGGQSDKDATEKNRSDTR